MVQVQDWLMVQKWSKWQARFIAFQILVEMPDGILVIQLIEKAVNIYRGLQHNV